MKLKSLKCPTSFHNIQKRILPISIQTGNKTNAKTKNSMNKILAIICCCSFPSAIGKIQQKVYFILDDDAAAAAMFCFGLRFFSAGRNEKSFIVNSHSIFVLFFPGKIGKGLLEVLTRIFFFFRK